LSQHSERTNADDNPVLLVCGGNTGTFQKNRIVIRIVLSLCLDNQGNLLVGPTVTGWIESKKKRFLHAGQKFIWTHIVERDVQAVCGRF